MSTNPEWRRGSLTKRERLACREAALAAVIEARVRRVKEQKRTARRKKGREAQERQYVI